MTHPFQRTALILLAGTALTACATPNYPITVAAAAPPPPAAPAPTVEAPPVATAPAPADAAPAALPPAPVIETRELAPLAPASLAPAAPAAEPARPVVLAEAPPAVPAAARTRAQAKGKVEEASGEAETYTVRKGDTLEKIAPRLGTTIEALAKENGLKKPYRLQPGQKLTGPRKAPQKTYVVASGDTLYAISRRFGVSVDALRDANGLGKSGAISPGRRLTLPGAGRDNGGRADAAPEAADQATGPDVERTPKPAARGQKKPPEQTAQEMPNAPPQVREVDTRGDVTRQVTGRVVEISIPGKAYKVRKGDTLEKIAGRLDSDIQELAKLNKLKKPYRLQPGQTIRGPGDTAKAYTVGRGDTLALIARRFSVTEAELRSANGLRRGASVAPGRKLRLPSGYRDRGPVVSERRESAPVTETRPRTTIEPRETPAAEPAPPPAERPAPPPRTPPRNPPAALPDRPQPYTRPPGGITGAPVASPPPTDAQVMDMGRGRFQWPLRGEIISGFGGRGTGPRNDGLNIRAAAGDPVRSAASGDVVYAGDQVPGFGNLVLIKHADGWVTAYGHLGRVDVRMQQRVEAGQQIGVAGSTGGVGEPQLHFEVRYAPNPQERARPIDPSLVLPR